MSDLPKKPILCLDFDGVLHSYSSGWKGAAEIPDPPVEGALEFLIEASRRFEIFIFSSRSNQTGGIDAMRRAINGWFLTAGYPVGLAHGMCFDHEGGLGTKSALKFPTEKPPAFVTIDDRAVTFTGEWPAMDALLSFKPWNKK